MEPTTAIGGGYAAGGNGPTPASTKIESAAQAAHQATDKVADKATEQVERLSASTHRAIDSAGSAASSAAQWASTIPEQAKHMQDEFVRSASASIRARPIATVIGALAVGYLLGRLARW